MTRMALVTAGLLFLGASMTMAAQRAPAGQKPARPAIGKPQGQKPGNLQRPELQRRDGQKPDNTKRPDVSGRAGDLTGGKLPEGDAAGRRPQTQGPLFASHGVATQGDDLEIYGLAVMPAPRKPQVSASEKPDASADRLAAPEQTLTGVLNLAGQNYLLVDVEVEYENRLDNTVDAKASGPTDRRPPAAARGKIVSLTASLAAAPSVQKPQLRQSSASGAKDASSIAPGEPHPRSELQIVGKLSAKIVEKVAGIMGDKKITAAVLVGTASFEQDDAWKLMGRVDGAPKASGPRANGQEGRPASGFQVGQGRPAASLEQGF